MGTSGAQLSFVTTHSVRTQTNAHSLSYSPVVSVTLKSSKSTSELLKKLIFNVFRFIDPNPASGIYKVPGVPGWW